MRINLIGVSVLALSALGLGNSALEKAQSYVIKQPDGAHASFALQMIVELQARRLLSEESSLANDRQQLIQDLVYRPGRALKVTNAAYDANEKLSSSSSQSRTESPSRPTSASVARGALQHLEVHSKRFSRELRACRTPPPLTIYFDCLADAMDTYAVAVEKMPPTPHSLAPVAGPALREGARRIRAATTVKQARAAVARVIADVRKSINLVPAGGEDTVRRLEISQRSVVIGSMVEIDSYLVTAIGI